MWIYQNKKWPDLTWDIKALSNKLAEIRHKQGVLLGSMGSLGFELKQEASLKTLTSDVVKSSAIEGKELDAEEVRSSIARRLGIDAAGLIPSSRDVEGIVEMMLDATQNFSKPLTQKRLFDWHAALFPTGRSGMHQITVANWRTASSGQMQVVSGAIGKEKIHFEAPSAETLKHEIKLFLSWFNKKGDIDPVLKAGIAHFWFVTIHPFEDGNGRIARAVGDMALARSDNTPYRFYSLSSQIESERTEYYNQLEKQQRGTTDITNWLSWFLDCLGRSIASAEHMLSNTLFKSQLWNKINQNPVNERQSLIINRMLEHNFKGHMNTSKYANMVKCSDDTALRDIQNLKARGILIQNQGGGRSTSYSLTDSIETIV
jgi:Fic family protein